LQTDWSIIVGVGGALANLVWMLATLKIKEQISLKLDALKEWMDQRFVSTIAFTAYREMVAIQHVEVERRLTKLELASETGAHR